MSDKDRRSETPSRERLPVTDPEIHTVSDPETPTVTDPQTPPVMDPEIPPVMDPETPTVTDLQTPTATDREIPPVTDPETPTVTDPETPTVADPDMHPETRTDKHADKYSEELTKALPEQLNDEQPEQVTDKYPEQLTEKHPVELTTENLEQLIEKHPEEPTSQNLEKVDEDNQDIDSPIPSETFISSKRYTTGDMRREVTSRIITYKNLGVDQFAFYKEELEHQLVYTRTRLVRWVQWLPDMRLWNIFMCMTVLGAIVMAITYDDIGAELASVMDTAYNMLYLVYVAGFALNIHTRDSHITTGELFRFVADAISYVRVITNDRLAMIACYTIRTIRPLEYLCTVKDFNLKGSVLGTTFKWTYLFLMVRVIMTIVKMAMNKIMVPVLYERHIDVADYSKELLNATFIEFLLAFHNIDKMFIPVGTHMEMSTNADQIFCMLVVMLGCFMMTGAAVASLSLVFSLYMMPEEVFRGRYRLIMKELEVSYVQSSMRQTVETFYKMYWKKQRAVSTAELLKILPPSLYNEIITDIYFQAIQKSSILRNLPSHFMPEIAKEMTTLHYIPGDTIIHRAKPKQAMYYITYGDIEMVTAEDDSTSILRFTRGTILTPSSGCIVVGCGASHVTIRAATFCTAYKLRTVDLWKKAIQQSRERDFSSDILLAFFEQFERIKLHYIEKPHPKVNYLSSIYHFRLGLNKLKNYRDSKGKKLLGENIFLEIAGTYIMRNNLLSEDPICIRQTFPCILQPTSSLLDAWSIFVTLCTLIITFTHPYTLAFKEEIPLRFIYFDQLIMGIFLLDLIVNLSTGEHIEEGQLVSIGQTAAHQACSRRFFTDVMAILPVFNFIGDGRFGGMNKLIKLPKLFHFLAMLENQCVYYSHIIRFLSYTFLVGTVSYLIAAFNQAMMCYSFDMCDITNLTTLQHWGTVTDDDNGHDTVSVREQRRVYFGLYWSISLVSLTSYEQSFPPEFLKGSYYTLFLLELVTLLYIFIEAVYSATIMVTSAMHDDFDAVIRIVKDFMERNRINAEVTKRFITYLELCWYTDQAYAITHKKQSIFHDLPPHVYQDIVAKQHMAYIKVIPFMKILSKRELTQIASKLKLFYTSPNEILLNTGDVTSEMYVIKQGTCEVLCPTTKTVIRYLKAKDHFGVPDCILGIPVYYTIRAATHVQVFSLGKRYFTKIVQHSGVINAIESIKKTEEFNVVHDSEYMPFVSYEPVKQPPNRSIFKLPRKYEKDVDFQSPFQQLGFLSILRYIFPRFTIRPDGKYLQRYEWFRAFCALCSAMVFPNYTYLSIQFPFLNFFRFFLDLSAYFDIVQRLLVGYYNEKGVLVYHPASTAANYIRTAFVMDFLGCIPLENLEPLRLQSATDDFQHRGYRITRNHQYLMFNRLLQLYRFIMTIDTLSTYMRKDFVLVLKYLPLFMTLCNVLSSFLVLYSVAIYYIPDSEGMRTRWQVSERWISPTLSRYYHTQWAVFNAEQYRFNITESPWNIHLATYFWVVYETTTTGYNSIFATDTEHLEILFFGMLINKMLYTYFSVRVISTRANVNKALCTFQEHMRDLNAFMVREHLDESLQWNIQSYYEYNWDMVGGIDSRSVLKMCDQVSLRTDTILQMYGSTFSECPILPTGDSSLLRILSRGIQDVHFRQNTEIIRENDVASKMYFIANGNVKIRGKVGETRMSATLTKGSVFGNLDAGRIRLPLKATAKTNVHMLEIGSSVFHHIIADFPTVDELMKRLRPNNECFIKASFHERARARRQKRKTIYTIEVVENFEKKVWTRHPFVLVFMIVITLITIYTDMYHVAFGNIKRSTIIVLYITDVLFFLKIPMMVTIPPNEELKIKQKLRELRKEYFKFEFIVDLISVLPLEALCFLYPANKWQFFAWLRLNRLFRIPTVYLNLYHYKQKMSINLTAATLGSVAIWFTLSMHAISCIWWMIGTVEETKMPKSSWRYNQNGSLMCENDYVCSFFFMLTTFTHNGDGGILPRKQSEIIYIVLIQIISTMVFMIYVGEFSNIIQFNNFRVFRYYSDYLELEAYLKNNNVSLNLLKLVKRYSMHLWRENRGIQIPEFLTTAPDTIRLRIMQAAYQKHLDAHPVFSLCEQAFLRQLVGCLKLYAYDNDMYIVREQEVTDSMYFIHKGSVVETKENQKSVVENKNKRFYHAGEYFGSGLLRRKPYPFTYKTVTIAQILILRMDDWEEIVKFYPRSKRAMYGFAGDFGDQGEARLHATFLDDGSRKSSLFPMDSRYSTTTMDSSYNLHPLESRKSIANAKLSDHTKKVLQDEYTHSQGDKQLKHISKLDKYYMEHEFQHSHHSHSRKNSSSSHLSRDSVVTVTSNTSIRALKFAGHPHEKSTAFQIPQRSPQSSTTSSMEPAPVKFYLRPSTTSDRSQATSKGASFMMHPSPDEQEARGLPFRTPSSNLHMSSDSDTMITAPILPLRSAPTDEPTFNVQRDLSYVKSWVNQLTKTAEMAAEARLRASVQTDSLNREPEVTPAKSQKETVSQGAAKTVQLKLRESVPNVSTDREPEPTPTKSRQDTGTQGAIIPNKDKPPRRNRYIIDMKHVDDDEDDESVAKTKPDNK